MNASASPADQLRVAIVQMNSAGTLSDNVRSIREAIATATRRRADAVLFPECAVTGYRYDFANLDGDELRESLIVVSEASAKHAVNVLIGTPIFCGGLLYNCLVVFNRQGQVVHCYAKCQLTPSDQTIFTPGNAISLFELDDVPVTAIICHERRYPELVRLAVMAGAKILFHPNAGLDTLAVSRTKRDGKDGIVARAFENAIYYVFANTVGSQGGGKWSAGDSKIVAPNGRVLTLADNENESVNVATLDLTKATGVYAQRGLERPEFLASHWKRMVNTVRKQVDKKPMHLRAESLVGLAD
jgi:predicted amidohydrolase